MKLRAVCFRSRILVVLCSMLGLLPTSAFAVGPDSVNYQGILTDAGGNPVADGNYSITLSIYDVAVGGAALWSESKMVATIDGLFNTLLGSVNPLPTSVFDGPNRFLGTTVSPDPEMTPRTAIVTVPYSHRVSTVDGATGGSITGGVDVEGDLTALNGVDPAFEVDVSGSQIRTFGSDGLEQIRLWGVGFGELLLYDNTDNNQTVRLSATTNSGGELHLRDQLGSANIVLDGGASGDASAVLPVDAINNDEILDEPGIANRIQGSGISLASMQDSAILIRTITVPADGYVIAFATGQADLVHGGGGFSGVTFGIVPTGGSLSTSPSVQGQVSGNAPAGDYRIPLSVAAAFDVSAGANQYTVEADNYGGNLMTIRSTQLTLLYVPTAYGLVTSNVANGSEEPLESREDEMIKSSQFNSQRIQSELAALRAKLDALQSQVDQNAQSE